MMDLWRSSERRIFVAVIMCLVCQNCNMCWSLNEEGLVLLRFRQRVVSDPFGALSNWNDDVGVVNPCSWFGVECSNGNVVVLNLKDLCLEGTLAPDLGDLVHIKSIILRNNSLSGIIPEEIGELKELEVLDLGYNHFCGQPPSGLGNNLSLTILLLDNNELLDSISPEIHELTMLSEAQVDENELSSAVHGSSRNKRSISLNIAETRDVAHRTLLQVADPPAMNRKVEWPTENSTSTSSSPSPAPSPVPTPSSLPTPTLPSPVPNVSVSPPSISAPEPSPVLILHPGSNHHVLILSVAIGGSAFLLILVIGIFYCRGSKMAVVKPWATGLSGQLQKAFVTGVPKLKRSELETACEDFSNVIGSSPIGTVYKGTLSSGVEISVVSVAVTSSKDWFKNLEVQFRNKIDTLSKVNHKNFANLLGYCEEDEPFTRMIVFEYAPNGTLFEHLHIREAEHLDWVMRVRIAMGMAYCLEYMHQLTPPMMHKNLNSSAVHLTEDYAAKISDFGFWNDAFASDTEKHSASNVYSFGVILFEIVTGRLPYSADNISSSLEDWASDYLRGGQPHREMADPTLKSFDVDQLEQVCEVIKSCVHSDKRQRPEMREVTARLREITGIGPDGAMPKLSPLWWAELEILSTEAN